jgi:hypothetical protein
VSAILEAVQSLAAQNSEAFGDLVVKILCTLAELDRAAYECLMGGMISRELSAAGLSVALAQAKQAFSRGQYDRSEERITAIEQWLHSVEGLGSRERLEIRSAEEPATRTTPPHSYVM